MMIRHHLLSFAALLSGCAAHAGSAARTAPGEGPAPPASIAVPRTVVTPEEARSVDEIFAAAQADLANGDPKRAAARFDRVVRTDPDGPLAPAACLHGAEAHDLLGDQAAAIARLEQLVRRYPDHALRWEALVRLVRLYAYLERWERAGWAATALLPHVDELPPLQQVVTFGGKALSLIFTGDVDAATYFVEKGRNVVDAHQLDRAGRLPRDLAQLYFALGEIRRTHAGQIRFVPPPADFAAALEERCQLLLDAQSAYSDAMRAYDAHWSAMAGYRVGELYQSLHADLMAMPPPAAANSRERQLLFEGAMRLRYSILLEKAGAMMDHTLRMAERVGEQSAWVEKSRRARAAVDQAIARENAVIDALPYSRAQLRAALDELAKRNPRP